MALIETLTDDFSAGLNTTRWPTAFNTTVTGGAAVITGAGLLKSQAIYTATGSSLTAKIVPNTATTGNGQWMQIQQDGSNWAGMFLYGGYLGMYVFDGGGQYSTGITYDPAMLWWRIRHDGTKLWFDTSADGFTWTSTEAPRQPTNWSPASTTLYAQFSTQASGTGTIMTIDNVNLAPTYTPNGIIGLGIPGEPAVSGTSAATTISPSRIPTELTFYGEPSLVQYYDGAYGSGAYGDNPYQSGPITAGGNPAPSGAVDNGQTGQPSAGTPTTSGYGSGNYSDSLYNGTTNTPADPTTDGYGSGDYGTGLYPGDNDDQGGGADTGYGSGIYGDDIYPGVDTADDQPTPGGYGTGPYGDSIYPGETTQPPGAGTPGGDELWQIPDAGRAMHILGIGPWNPRQNWRGAPNYGIGAGPNAARPIMNLPGVQSMTFTLRLDGGNEATVTTQYGRQDALIIDELHTDLWWRRKDPHTGQLEMIGRFNTSTNDLARTSEGLVTSNLQFVDYRTLLADRMVLKYLTTTRDAKGAVTDQQSMWNTGTNVTQILRWALPTNLGLDLSALDDSDALGKIKQPFTLPPNYTMAQLFDDLDAIATSGFEWWIDTPADVTKAPKLAFAYERGSNKNVVLYDSGISTSPIASWTMRAAANAYANTLYFQAKDGGAVVNIAAQVTENGERDAQASNSSLNGSLAEIKAAADKKLKTLSDRRPTFTLELRPGFWKGRAHIDAGDTIRVILRLGNDRIDYQYRVTELAVTVDTNGAETVTLTLGRPLTSADPRSHYSPLTKLVRTLRDYVTPTNAVAIDTSDTTD